MDKRRIRRQDRDYYGLYIRMDDSKDIAALDQISAKLRHPRNSELIHALVTDYLKHNKMDIMA
jgi:hypothetical protein